MTRTYRFFLVSLFLFLITAQASAAAACTITVTVSGDTYEDQLPWNGCGLINQSGLQNALNQQANNSSIRVKLKGAGRIIVPAGNALQVKSNTVLYSDGAARETVVISPEFGALRTQGDNLIRIDNASDTALWNLNVNGSDQNYNAIGPLIKVSNGTRTRILANKITAHNSALSIFQGSGVQIKFNSIENKFLPNSQVSFSTPGQAIWMNGTKSSEIDKNSFSQLTYYNLPTQPRVSPSDNTRQAPVDTIAVYSTDGLRITRNFIKYAHTAGIYTACGVGGFPLECSSGDNKGLVIWDNRIKYTKQHGIDVVYAKNPRLIANKVCSTGLSLINLAAVDGGLVRYNVAADGGLAPNATSREGDASLHLVWGTNDVSVLNNTFHNYHGGPAVSTLEPAPSNFPAATNNDLANNYFETGSGGLYELLSDSDFTFTNNITTSYTPNTSHSFCNF